MKNKKKKNNTVLVPKEQRDLGYYMANFKETCDHKSCGQPLVVHAYRPKSNHRREIVYAHCENRGKCPRAMLEIAFIEYYL